MHKYMNATMHREMNNHFPMKKVHFATAFPNSHANLPHVLAFFTMKLYTAEAHL